MIPDVQKLINQSGNVSIDIFNTRLIKPPTSVLVFPLKVWTGSVKGILDSMGHSQPTRVGLHPPLLFSRLTDHPSSSLLPPPLR